MPCNLKYIMFLILLMSQMCHCLDIDFMCICMHLYIQSKDIMTHPLQLS